MKKNIFLILFILPTALFGQFDFYGPKTFSNILTSGFNTNWTPTPISNITNKKYVVILDKATMSKAVMLNYSSRSILEVGAIDSLNSSNATYGSVMRSVFQMVDENTHYENSATAASGPYTPLSGRYKLNPLLHSYYALNTASNSTANCTDGGSFYIGEESNTGYLLIEFVGTPNSAIIKAVGQWQYDALSDSIVEVSGWATKYLAIGGNSLTWVADIGNASSFYLADANDLLNIEIAAGSDFNPHSVTYQSNATAAIPKVDAMEDNHLITELALKITPAYVAQLGTSALATTNAEMMLDNIETTLTNHGDSLRYPKQFYLNLRKNLLSHKIAGTDVYNVRLGHNNIEHVYFTNASDDNGVPHPFMVIAAFAVSSRPNMLVDVNRPPGASGGPGYAESQVTRHAKVGDFLLKIPLKDYGVITNLLDNDLSPYGDLASEFDTDHGTTTTKNTNNYVALASCGLAVDGVTIYPAFNNNIRFAVEDAEVTSSGIHVGGGLELHYHADGHSFNGNGFNLYNISDYAGKDHPPVIGMGHDGIALFGKYETAYSAMVGYGIPLDAFGGHNHGDGFGYHYHAHAESVTSITPPNVTFTEHYLMVGAWKGNINNIPGFQQGKLMQFDDAAIARYAGVSYTGSTGLNPTDYLNNSISIYPNPTDGLLNIQLEEDIPVTVCDATGKELEVINLKSGDNVISMEKYDEGIYFIMGTNSEGSFCKKIIVKK